MSIKPETKELDGRRLRGERSRQAIVDAALSLVEEGVLIPTAQQIADRAGVGIRSFFRHFDDMETLFLTVDEQIRGGYKELFLGGDRTGSLDERMLHALECHASAYDSLVNIILCGKAQHWRYKALRNNYERYQRALRKDLQDWLPEVQQLSTAEREAIDAIASFEMWNRLREYQGLNKKQSIDIIYALLQGLLK